VPATLTPPQTRRRSSRGSGLGGHWRVIVLNDAHNTFDGVAEALAAVIPGVDYAAGLRLADAIHTTGRAIVWSGDKELAELYWGELDARGLTMAPLENG
jgi:ATP-dependent Clp protease adaptor protein ClpS